MTGVSQECAHSSNVLLYMDILEMYAGICCVLSRCVSLDEACHSIVLHTHNAVHSLLALLDPVIYCEFLNRCLHCSMSSSSYGCFLYVCWSEVILKYVMNETLYWKVLVMKVDEVGGVCGMRGQEEEYM
jgi:hypothetical protein